VLAAVATLLIAASVVAKGETSAFVEPLDPTAGDPTDVTFTLTMEGHEAPGEEGGSGEEEGAGGQGEPMTGLLGVFVRFTQTSPERTAIEVRATEIDPGVYRATVTFPYEGRWSMVTGIKGTGNGGNAVDYLFQMPGGTTVEVAPPAAAAPVSAPSSVPVLAIALAAALAGLILGAGGGWLLATRRGARIASEPQPAEEGRRVPA